MVDRGAGDGEFDPRRLLGCLEEHEVLYVVVGGLAATLHGSPHVTFDVDVTPERSRENLERLADALRELEARIRAPGEPEGVPFDADADFLERVEILNLRTRYGPLDVVFLPSGTHGYEDLRRDAEQIEVHGVRIAVASLPDVIRSKEAAGRERDRVVLPALRRLLEMRDGEGGAR